MAGLIQQRLAELSDAETLSEMRHIVGARCHELTGNLKGWIAVDLVHPDRLVFEPADDPVPRKEDGGLDWAGVKQIQVVGIGNYHPE